MRLSGKLKQIAPVVALLLLIGAVVLMIVQYLRRDNDYQAAQKALDRRDFRAASVLLKRWLSGHPRDRDALLLAAQTSRRRGSLDEARNYLEECQRVGSRSEGVAHEQRLLRVQQGHLAEADALLKACLDHPDDSDPLVLEAVIEALLRPSPSLSVPPDLKRLLRAADLWLGHRHSDADQAQGFVWRGRIHRQLEEHGAAVADFRRALELDPDHFDARLNLALTIAQEAPEETATHLQRLHERDPDNVHVSYSLATVRRGLGQLEQARVILDDILASKPETSVLVSALVERALISLDEGHPKQAEPRLRQALTLAPTEPEVRLALSRCLQMSGRTDEAKVHQEQFLRLDAERKRKQREEKRSAVP